MSKPNSTRNELNQTASGMGMQVTTQGLDKRFTPKASDFLKNLLEEAVKTMISGSSEQKNLLTRFNGVYVGDSTVVSLPDALAAQFRGNNGESDSAVKIGTMLELVQGNLKLWLHSGTVHDQKTGILDESLPQKSVRLNDLGFFNLDVFERDIQENRYFFTRYRVGTLVYAEDGTPIDLPKRLAQQKKSKSLDFRIQLGAKRLPCRLIALPTPPEQVEKRVKTLKRNASRKQRPLSERSLALSEWTLYLTNIPMALLATHEASILGRTRWQIECLFKLWKSDGLLDESRSQNPDRVLCEFYAKLLAIVVQHWIILVGCWQNLDRSLHFATQVIQKRAISLLDALGCLLDLVKCLTKIARVMTHTCKLSTRGEDNPSSHQLLKTS